MNVYERLFDYYLYRLTEKYPHTSERTLKQAAHAHAAKELEPYDEREDFERTWNQVLEAAS